MSEETEFQGRQLAVEEQLRFGGTSCARSPALFSPRHLILKQRLNLLKMFSRPLQMTVLGTTSCCGKQLHIPQDPLCVQVLHQHHDAPAAGHGGHWKMKHPIAWTYWWSMVQADVADYIYSCDTCAYTKQPLQRHQPLPNPNQPWQFGTMDFTAACAPCRGTRLSW